MTQSLVLSGWSVLSPFGVGRDVFAQGVSAGTPALLPAASPPMSQVGVVPGFDVREALGAKGTRAMDRVTGLAVTTVGLVLEEMTEGVGDGEEIALVLGTTTGSLHSMMEFVKDSFIQSKPFQVDPARFPNAVMNRAAGQCAIWYGLRGPNATIAGGRAAGLAVLEYASRLCTRERATGVLCGVAEEFSEHRAWLEYSAAGAVDRPLGEGCAVFVLESADSAHRAGRRTLAELVRVEMGVWSTEVPVEAALSRLLRRVLNDTAVPVSDIGVVMAGGDSVTDPCAGFAAAERAGIRDVLPDTEIRTVSELVGDAGAATGGFQLAALLAAAETMWPSHAVITSVDPDGVVGCALIRRPDPAGAPR